jgi:hypothetical protein
VRAALAGLVTPGNHLIGDGGKAIAAFARRAGFRSTPGKPTPTRLTGTSITSRPNQSRLKHWLAANYLGWRRALKAWGNLLAPPNWINGVIGSGPYQQLTL